MVVGGWDSLVVACCIEAGIVVGLLHMVVEVACTVEAVPDMAAEVGHTVDIAAQEVDHMPALDIVDWLDIATSQQSGQLVS